MICVYKHLDKEGKLLYVGSTTDFFERCKQHAKSHWAQHIVRIDIAGFETFLAAQAAEKSLILSESPIFNMHMKPRKKKGSRWDIKNHAEITEVIRAHVRAASKDEVIRFAATAKIPAHALLGLIENEYVFSAPEVQRMVDAIEYLGISGVTINE